MKVVIPGGSGQVGTILARAFHRDGHDVVVLSRHPETRPWRVVRWDAWSMGNWQRELDRLYAPHRVVFSIPADVAGLDAAIADKKPGTGTRPYICRGSTCSAPIEALADLVRTAQARV